jgi:hypothetical protein
MLMFNITGGFMGTMMVVVGAVVMTLMMMGCIGSGNSRGKERKKKIY